MIAAAKFLHLASIALWSGGLIALPFLYRERTKDLEGEALHELHRFVRYFYVRLFSPAAFVAIGSGILLIFLSQPYAPWFSVKLLLVAGMVFLHMLAGLLILSLFEPGQHVAPWRIWVSTVLNVAVVTAIITIVLGKPSLFSEQWLQEVFTPGALGNFGNELIGGVI